MCAGLLVCLLLTQRQIAADTHYVSTNGPHLYPFTSWDNAATNIQAALDAAADGDAVLVSNGVYYIARTVVVSNSSLIFASVNGYEETAIDAQSVSRVFETVKEVSDTTIRGFTFRNGRHPSRPGVSLYGGGVFEHCCVEDCVNYGEGTWSGPHGGGIGIYSGSRNFFPSMTNTDITMRNCVIRNNRAVESTHVRHGGGLYFYPATGNHTIENTLFEGNEASSQGGGVYVDRGIVRFRNCTFRGNFVSLATGAGGGMRTSAESSSYVTLEECLIVSNYSNGSAGGLYCPRATVSNCTVLANTCRAGFTAMQTQSGVGGVRIMNTLVTRNTNGCPVYLRNSKVDNLTLCDNQTASSDCLRNDTAGGYWSNILVYGNRKSTGATSRPMFVGASLTVGHACLPSGTDTSQATFTNCIYQNPLFVDADAGDYRLSESSPCIDAGITNGLTRDIEGTPRGPVPGGGPWCWDIGCYEWQSPLPRGLLILFR